MSSRRLWGQKTLRKLDYFINFETETMRGIYRSKKARANCIRWQFQLIEHHQEQRKLYLVRKRNKKKLQVRFQWKKSSTNKAIAKYFELLLSGRFITLMHQDMDISTLRKLSEAHHSCKGYLIVCFEDFERCSLFRDKDFYNFSLVS